MYLPDVLKLDNDAAEDVMKCDVYVTARLLTVDPFVNRSTGL